MKNLLEDIIYRIRYRHRYYINAYVNRGDDTNDKNWGDDINYWFLKEIIKEPIRLYNESPIAFRENDENYLIIGSTISLLAKSSSIVWGAGCIDVRPLPAFPKQVLAVRGPLTQKYLNKIGIKCPDIYGDPALLLPLYYRPNFSKKHKIGLIHHVSEKPFNIKGAHLISMSNYDTWTDVIDEICSCEYIASSSLHGLIVAEAYGIPCVWTQSNKLIGGHFKFHDFFQSLGTDVNSPIVISDSISITELVKSARTHGGLDFDLSPLLKVCPFELNNISISV